MKRRESRIIPKTRSGEKSGQGELTRRSVKGIGLLLISLLVLLGGYETAIQTYRSLPERDRAYYENLNLFPENFPALAQSMETEGLFRPDFLIPEIPELMVNETRRNHGEEQRQSETLSAAIDSLPVSAISVSFGGGKYQTVYYLNVSRQERGGILSFRGSVQRFGQETESFVFPADQSGIDAFISWAHEHSRGILGDGPSISNAILSTTQTVSPDLVRDFSGNDPLVRDLVAIVGTGEFVDLSHMTTFTVLRRYARYFQSSSFSSGSSTTLSILLRGTPMDGYPPYYQLSLDGGLIKVYAEQFPGSFELDPAHYPALAAFLSSKADR